MPSQMPVDPSSAPGAPTTLKCDNCKMEIDGTPFAKGDRTFCCDGCAYGGPCVC